MARRTIYCHGLLQWRNRRVATRVLQLLTLLTTISPAWHWSNRWKLPSTSPSRLKLFKSQGLQTTVTWKKSKFLPSEVKLRSLRPTAHVDTVCNSSMVICWAFRHLQLRPSGPFQPLASYAPTWGHYWVTKSLDMLCFLRSYYTQQKKQ